MDLTPLQLTAIHEGYKSLTTPADGGSSGHSTRRRPGKE